ncbi:MAG TPA: D-erythronate dehydrogenase, partial [Polyangiaceae bacterium]|nr:D-erythronate dehydrogenase [Polyangiaceae bacterium]
MKLLITGGAGFLGGSLARSLLRAGSIDGRCVERLVLADQAPVPEDLARDARIGVRTGALLEQCAELGRERFDGVFHLASAVSAECERDFDLGLRSNLDTTRALLLALRAAGNTPRLVFSSSAAVFGGDPPSLPLPSLVEDGTLPTPQTSYGAQKFACEQLIADFTRKGFIDGRSVRLLTVSVRPGKPNGAASGFLSGIIREPLAGLPSVCPVPLETEVALASPRSAISALCTVYAASRDAFGGRTALNLPALCVSVREMLVALEAVAGPDVRALVRLDPDPSIERIVATWPARFSAVRAGRLGLRADASFRAIIEQYVSDHPQVVKVAVSAAA